jgi:hypothetical protein
VRDILSSGKTPTAVFRGNVEDEQFYTKNEDNDAECITYIVLLTVLPQQ